MEQSSANCEIATFPFDTLSIEKRILVTFGYVHDIERNYELSSATPVEINEIIWSYNKCTDTWNDKYLNKEQIQLQGNKIKSLTETTATIYGNISLSSGSHTWKLRIVARPKNSYRQQPFIGFIKDEPAVLKNFVASFRWYLKDNGYIYCSGDGIHGYNSATLGCGKRCKNDNDILDITLNLDEHKIYLSVNGEEAFVPESFTNIREGKYRLVVTLHHGKDTTIELL